MGELGEMPPYLGRSSGSPELSCWKMVWEVLGDERLLDTGCKHGLVGEGECMLGQGRVD